MAAPSEPFPDWQRRYPARDGLLVYHCGRVSESIQLGSDAHEYRVPAVSGASCKLAQQPRARTRSRAGTLRLYRQRFKQRRKPVNRNKKKSNRNYVRLPRHRRPQRGSLRRRCFQETLVACGLPIRSRLPTSSSLSRGTSTRSVARSVSLNFSAPSAKLVSRACLLRVEPRHPCGHSYFPL